MTDFELAAFSHFTLRLRHWRDRQTPVYYAVQRKLYSKTATMHNDHENPDFSFFLGQLLICSPSTEDIILNYKKFEETASAEN